MAHEEERRRIARDLHDGISQRLALLVADLEAAAIDAADAAAQRRCRHLARTAGDVAAHVNRISQQLYPAKLETLGLVAAIGAFCQELWNSDRLRVRFTHDDPPRSVPGDLALCVYRVVQEGLRNVIAHSGVRDADVHLSGRSHELLVRVADAGRGFVPEARGGTGLGLISIRERVAAIGGTLVVHTAPGLGTRIVVKLDAEP